ncbi:MAG: hypothetical protein EBZ91_13325 [Gammaproteobacteria bacterium]|nr:hypothetical protein [Gammaproteobacteria bacterium]
MAELQLLQIKVVPLTEQIQTVLLQMLLLLLVAVAVAVVELLVHQHQAMDQKVVLASLFSNIQKQSHQVMQQTPGYSDHLQLGQHQLEFPMLTT